MMRECKFSNTKIEIFKPCKSYEHYLLDLSKIKQNKIFTYIHNESNIQICWKEKHKVPLIYTIKCITITKREFKFEVLSLEKRKYKYKSKNINNNKNQQIKKKKLPIIILNKLTGEIYQNNGNILQTTLFCLSGILSQNWEVGQWPCVTCNKKATKRCNRCKSKISYCSRKCQKIHWKYYHRNVCKSIFNY